MRILHKSGHIIQETVIFLSASDLERILDGKYIGLQGVFLTLDPEDSSWKSPSHTPTTS